MTDYCPVCGESVIHDVAWCDQCEVCSFCCVDCPENRVVEVKE